MPPFLLIMVALSVLGFVALGSWALAARSGRHRALTDRAVVTAHWESLVMQRRDLRLAVDALGVPTLHGRVGALAYTIIITAPSGAWGGRPLALAAVPSPAGRLALCRKGEREVPVPGLPATLTTGDDDFDAVYDVRCDEPEAARARLNDAVRAALLSIPGAFASVDGGGLRVDLGASATTIDGAMLDALREVLRGLSTAAPPAVAAG